jgi:hypothetical protein
MIYLRGVLFGAGGALIAAVLWVLVAFVVPVVLPMLMSRISGNGAGAGGAAIGVRSIYPAALIGFAAGFYLGIRR